MTGTALKKSINQIPCEPVALKELTRQSDRDLSVASWLGLKMAGSGSMSDKWSIDKLDGSNWTTWKFQMRRLLLAKRLWGHVEGTEVIAEGASVRAQMEFRQKSQEAFSTIVMTISTSQLYLVTSYERPKEIRRPYAITSNARRWQTNCFSRSNILGWKRRRACRWKCT